MENQENIKDKVNSTMKNWKASLEHLNMQMHLGSMEARDEFENQKKALNKWAHSVEETIRDGKKLGAEKTNAVKGALEELKLQAALGKAETKDALKDQQEKINSSLQKLKQSFNKTMDPVQEDLRDFSEEARHRLEDFQTRFDLFRVQLHLGKEEAKDVWEERKKQLSQKLQEVKAKSENVAEGSSDRWDKFSEEMSEAWSHIRNAFKG